MNLAASRRPDRVTLGPLAMMHRDDQGHFEPVPDQTERDSQSVIDSTETKKPRETVGFAGFSEERLMRFELTTTTLATLQHSEQNAANCGAKRDDAERLHQWLHQIAESGERSVASALAEAIAETLGSDAVWKLVEAVESMADRRVV